MSDLIYKKDAVTLPVMPKRYRKYQTYNLDDAYEQGWEDLQKCIDRFPSAQPQRKKGKWILETFQIRCSQCNKLFSDNLFPSNYCPSCGARMDGESDE